MHLGAGESDGAGHRLGSVRQLSRPGRSSRTAEASLDAYLDAAGIAAEKDAPLWRSMPRAGGMGARRMSQVDVFRMIKRRVTAVWLGEANCHTFRATGITAYLLNGGTLERAQAIAAHESPRTTKLYDRTADCCRSRESA